MASAIEIRIDGTFEGWDGETIVKFTNGEIYQQTILHYEYHHAYTPEVTIYRAGNGYRVEVEGTRQEAQVTRLK